MDLLCRLCCKHYDIPKMENFFDDKNKHLLDKLNYFACFSFRIHVNDGFPPYICIRCTNMLRTAYEFKMICESAEANFWALSQSTIADTTEMDVGQFEFKDVIVSSDSCATETTTFNDVIKSEICEDESGEGNTNELDRSIHLNVTGTKQSTAQLRSEKRKICTTSTGSTCDTRGKSFRRKREQKIVRRKLWICESCGRRFRTQYSLRYHINGTHVDTVEKNYSCDLCDYKCRQAHYLISHALRHTGARPHKCEECGLAFGVKGSLNRHTQAVHRNSRPHKCTICDRYFKNTVQLRAHLNYHSGHPFECPECPKTYRYNNNLVRHTKKCHRRVTISQES